MAEQTYATHRRFHPLFHFFAVPVLTVNFLAQLHNAIRYTTWTSLWQVFVGAALVVSLFLARFYALRNQDRLIRLEEILRLSRCLPEEMKNRIGELRTGQLVALRFASDAELPDLCRAIFAGEVRGREEIKKRIGNWRADVERI